MKFLTTFLFSSLMMICTGGFAAHASEMSMANHCLNYGKQVMKDNPEIMSLLSQAKITEGSVQVNNYSTSLGKQFISTELVAEIHRAQEKTGGILCLFESDTTPLYFHLTRIK